MAGARLQVCTGISAVRDYDSESGLPGVDGPRPAACDRCLGARLLPEAPVPSRGTRHRVVVACRLGGGRQTGPVLDEGRIRQL